MPTKKHPHPLDAKQPARKGEHPRGYQAPSPARPPRPHPHPSHHRPRDRAGQHRRAGGMHGAREPLKSTTQREEHCIAATTSNTAASISAKQQRKSSSREANSNDIEHSTLRHGHAELSDATKQREEPSPLQATVSTAASMAKRHEHNSEATRQRNAKNIQHQQHDATRM